MNADQTACASASQAILRVAVWSSFQPLAQALCELVQAPDLRTSTLEHLHQLPLYPPHDRPQVLVLDVDARPRDVAGLITSAAKSANDVAIVAVSILFDSRLVALTLAAGARGYVTKDRAIEELVLAVRAASQGVCYISRTLDGYDEPR